MIELEPIKEQWMKENWQRHIQSIANVTMSWVR